MATTDKFKQINAFSAQPALQPDDQGGGVTPATPESV